MRWQLRASGWGDRPPAGPPGGPGGMGLVANSSDTANFTSGRWGRGSAQPTKPSRRIIHPKSEDQGRTQAPARAPCVLQRGRRRPVCSDPARTGSGLRWGEPRHLRGLHSRVRCQQWCPLRPPRPEQGSELATCVSVSVRLSAGCDGSHPRPCM